MSDVDEKPTERIISVAVSEKEAESLETGNVDSKDEKNDSSDLKANIETTMTFPIVQPSKLECDIIRQVEYYFGDANLNRDKFLLEQVSKNDQGWVPLSVLLTFKRLAALSTDPSAIVNALLKSDEGLLEISEDKQEIRRHPERPIPEHNEERRKEIMSRTAYVKGFPLDIEMSELIDFFSLYVKVLNINMRKYLDKPTKTYKFKGSVFVTFEKKEQAQEFIEKDKVLFKERELTRKWQEIYLNEKKEELKSHSKKKTKPAEEEQLQLPKGAVLFFKGANDNVTREILREALEKIEGDWEVAYIDYSKGDKEGYIRFHQEDSAAQFLEKLEGNKLKIAVDNIELLLRTLTAEEEKVFLDKAIEHMKNRRNHQNKHKGGHQGNRKRRGGHDNRNDEKKKKSDN